MYRVRHTNPILPGPVLVHCSAGIGRTGTYIALDILLDRVEKADLIDVSKVIIDMRNQRKGIVQTTEQYECIFLTLLELCNHGKTSLANGEYLQQYAEKKGSTVMGTKTIDELAEEVESLNNTPFTDSPDKYKVLPGGQDKECAMLLPSKLANGGYLLIKDIKGAEKRFWKLMTENDSYTIITLSSETGIKFIPKLSGSMTHGGITISARRQTTLCQELTETILQVKTKGETKSREIQHYRINGWSSTLDSSKLISILTLLTEKIHKKQKDVGQHPVAIVYRESEAKNAIILCIANNIMAGIWVDNEVEIFTNIRMFQAMLPNVTVTQEDFTLFCKLAFEASSTAFGIGNMNIIQK
ncbi:receptor-type tyrosine-protein phosphatase epsilon-like [Gigantopelta aegis]|uniref:receptor-type tyrosine-protein phosphatase epsilon-like n=1 Tax=Gigantopelta aegis TaxID=1735272 RepID=UPI001B887561|nr:receptor-type tyrosine-protein phosphatase epsilon-like [Gigantopelta aegis]